MDVRVYVFRCNNAISIFCLFRNEVIDPLVLLLLIRYQKWNTATNRRHRTANKEMYYYLRLRRDFYGF